MNEIEFEEYIHEEFTPFSNFNEIEREQFIIDFKSKKGVFDKSQKNGIDSESNHLKIRTMSSHKILIAGAIGQFQQPNGKFMNGVTLLDVVGQVNSAPEGTTEIVVQIESLGGVKEVGDQIYDYLVSLKPKYKIKTEQLGTIASIATKVFGAGDERIALEGESFMIHNPWTIVQGDANELKQTAEALKVAEEDLLGFYVQLTGIPKEGLVPLLNSETEFDAETAVKLKLATSTQKKNKLKIAAMKSEKMENLLTQFVAFLNKFNSRVLNTIVELEDSSKLYFETEDLSKLEGTPVYKLDAEGNPTTEPAPDGTYKLKDGRTITLSGGKVASVETAQAETVEASKEEPKKEEPKKEEMAMMEKIEQIALALQTINVMSKEDIIKEIDARFVALRNDLKVKHTPKAFVPSDSIADAEAWDKAFKENRIAAMKKNDPEHYQRLFFAKYGKMPNM
jgi:ATP-dependent protease ClpP protease subunit